jgi:hypothetical protein
VVNVWSSNDVQTDVYQQDLDQRDTGGLLCMESNDVLLDSNEPLRLTATYLDVTSPSALVASGIAPGPRRSSSGSKRRSKGLCGRRVTNRTQARSTNQRPKRGTSFAHEMSGGTVTKTARTCPMSGSDQFHKRLKGKAYLTERRLEVVVGRMLDAEFNGDNPEQERDNDHADEMDERVFRAHHAPVRPASVLSNLAATAH